MAELILVELLNFIEEPTTVADGVAELVIVELLNSVEELTIVVRVCTGGGV